MALKIREMAADERGHVQAHGLFDGESFTMVNDGTRWLLNLVRHQPITMEVVNPRSRAEANGFLWSAVARIREAQKMRSLART